MIAETKEKMCKQFAFDTARSVLVDVCADRLKAMSAKRMVPKNSALKVIQALLYSLGVPKDAFVEAGTRRVNWESARAQLSDALIETMKTTDPASAEAVYPPHARTDALRALLQFDDDIAALGPVIPSVRATPLIRCASCGASYREAALTQVAQFVTAVCDLREAAAASRTAEAAAAAAAAADEE
jgi:hypothetical protein